jgi:hypothetical protein
MKEHANPEFILSLFVSLHVLSQRCNTFQIITRSALTADKFNYRVALRILVILPETDDLKETGQLT